MIPESTIYELRVPIPPADLPVLQAGAGGTGEGGGRQDIQQDLVRRIRWHAGTQPYAELPRKIAVRLVDWWHLPSHGGLYGAYLRLAASVEKELLAHPEPTLLDGGLEK